ncbi:hypothetical protein NC796_11045 [Aliifodinibius sp. S!AR15-10]|nr:hypothetical protein [Aliifodinibius sp. S!AR15-10]MDR8391681.1 hypothetical protein [Aliifodinibius sp. S!AR15-10]
MTSLDRIAFLLSYGYETIRTFISAEELLAEMVITLLFIALVIIAL